MSWLKSTVFKKLNAAKGERMKKIDVNLPQMAENNTPRSMDVAREFLL